MTIDPHHQAREDAGGPPRRRDAIRNRERLLAAAAEVFAESGASASLKDVAERAGLGIGTVYRHMPEKDAVIVALLRPQLEQLVTMADDALTRPATFAVFAELMRRIIGTMGGSRALSEVLLQQYDLPPDLRDPVHGVLSRCGDVLERTQRTGELRADLDVTDLVVCMTAAHATETAFEEYGPTARARLLEVLLDGMRVRRDAPSPLPVSTFDLAELIDASIACRETGEGGVIDAR